MLLLPQSCLTVCDPIDGSPPGSPVPGILQARTLEWVAISFSNEWKWKVKVKLLSRVRLLATPWTAAYQAPPSTGFSRQEDWFKYSWEQFWVQWLTGNSKTAAGVPKIWWLLFVPLLLRILGTDNSRNERLNLHLLICCCRFPAPSCSSLPTSTPEDESIPVGGHKVSEWKTKAILPSASGLNPVNTR